MEALYAPEPAPLPSAQATPSQARSIKHRLMNRVADADTSHLTVPADLDAWQPFCAGVSIKPLYEHQGSLSYLLKLDPGAQLPAHRHPQDEECLVLEGRLHIGSQVELGPGSYHLAHAGALHAVVASPGGATIFLRGAVPHIEQALV